MITYEECLEMCDLTEPEVEAIAEHEHTDAMIALALGQYLIAHQSENQIKIIILNDIQRAARCGRHQHEASLRQVLRQFNAAHAARHKQLAAG